MEVVGEASSLSDQAKQVKSESTDQSPAANFNAGSDWGRCLVAVCTYNEWANLPDLIAQIHSALPEADVLIVDDDSPDGTGHWALQQASEISWLHVLIRRNQRGLGGAVRAAIEFAIHADYCWMLNLDADHSHSPADLPRLLAAALHESPPLDCVVGTRYADGGKTIGWPRHRIWMSRLVNRFATTVLQLPVSDCSGSLRCYRVGALRQIAPESLRSRGYAIFEELLVRLRRSGAILGELPITFHERRSGESKLTFSEAIKSAAQIIRLASTRWS